MIFTIFWCRLMLTCSLLDMLAMGHQLGRWVVNVDVNQMQFCHCATFKPILQANSVIQAILLQLSIS